jgi:predicted Zn-dependent peptidase
MNTNTEISITGPNEDFESIKHIDENGVEFWTGRELFPMLGYSRWETFDEVIGRSAKSAMNSGQVVENHFRSLTKMVEIGSGSKRAVVGDIRPEDMERLLLDAGKGWNHTSSSSMRSVELNTLKDTPQKTFSSVPGKESVDVFMGAYIPLKSEDKETPAVLAALDLLGGGFSDHLMQTVRDRDGLTYGTLARIRGRESGNGFYWFAWAMFGNELFKKGIASLEKEIGVFLDAGISDTRYAEKIQELEGKLAVSFSSPLSAVSEIISGMLTTGNPSESDAFVTKLKAIDAKAVEGAARQYLKIDGCRFS